MSRSDRKSTRLNSSHLVISYAVFCLKKKEKNTLSALTLPRTKHTPASRECTVPAPWACCCALGSMAALLGSVCFVLFFFFFLNRAAPPNFPLFPPRPPLPT